MIHGLEPVAVDPELGLRAIGPSWLAFRGSLGLIWNPLCGIWNLPFDFFLFRRLILIGWNIFWTERHATTITTATLWRSTNLGRGTLNNKYFFSIFEDWNWNLILNLRIVRKLNSIFKIDLWLVNQSVLFFENFLNLNFFSQVTISSMDHYIII